MNQRFYNAMNSKWKSKLYLLMKLPAAFFSGVTVEEYNNKQCVVSVPYKWLTKNPFKSTYFASLSMAAELSTGVPALGAVYSSGAKVSMLVADIKGTFFKKATDKTWFYCLDIEQFEETVQQCIATNEKQTFSALAKGYNRNKELVAEFSITWSFKVVN